jgi:hypothetical protein
MYAAKSEFHHVTDSVGCQKEKLLSWIVPIMGVKGL